MSENRSQKAREIAFRRRRGASHEHSAKVAQNLLSAADLHTTCRRCKRRVTGTLEQINEHVEKCHD